MSGRREINTLSSRTELAAAAVSSVYALNEFSKAVEEDGNDANDHYMKAAVGAAIAVGAYHLISRKRNRDEYDSNHNDGGHHDNHSQHRSPPHSHNDTDPPHHKRHLIEEAAGAYALGRELLGDERHHIAHLIAEGLGAVGTIKDLNARHKSAQGRA